MTLVLDDKRRGGAGVGMEPSKSDDKSGAGIGARVLLGLFILWQLFFLGAYNFRGPLLSLRGELARRDDGPRGASFREVSAVAEPVAPGCRRSPARSTTRSRCSCQSPDATPR